MLLWMRLLWIFYTESMTRKLCQVHTYRTIVQLYYILLSFAWEDQRQNTVSAIKFEVCRMPSTAQRKMQYN